MEAAASGKKAKERSGDQYQAEEKRNNRMKKMRFKE